MMEKNEHFTTTAIDYLMRNSHVITLIYLYYAIVSGLMAYDFTVPDFVYYTTVLTTVVLSITLGLVMWILFFHSGELQEHKDEIDNWNSIDKNTELGNRMLVKVLSIVIVVNLFSWNFATALMGCMMISIYLKFMWDKNQDLQKMK